MTSINDRVFAQQNYLAVTDAQFSVGAMLNGMGTPSGFGANLVKDPPCLPDLDVAATKHSFQHLVEQFRWNFCRLDYAPCVQRHMP